MTLQLPTESYCYSRILTCLESHPLRHSLLQCQVVLTVDTRGLIEARAARILLTHMNPGATRPFAHERGRDTLLTIGRYPFQDCRRAVELTVARQVSGSTGSPVSGIVSLWRRTGLRGPQIPAGPWHPGVPKRTPRGLRTPTPRRSNSATPSFGR
jgi:hypothetical protein